MAYRRAGPGAETSYSAPQPTLPVERRFPSGTLSGPAFPRHWPIPPRAAFPSAYGDASGDALAVASQTRRTRRTTSCRTDT